MTRLGLVHTVPALAATFQDLVTAAVPADVELIHVVDPWLLRTAMAGDITPELVDRLAAHVAHLHGRGVAGVLVTCSTLGEATEQVREATGATVLRVDQGMADRAVELAGDGGRIAVLATLASTTGPTRRLLQRSAEEAGVAVTVDVDVVEGAGRVREDGAIGRHDELVAAAIAAWAPRADVVVLAQASMAAAADGIDAGAATVLSSPELAARRLADLAN
ncbi:aspartate/glutamate racemase family protein [Jiangella anatolica]|uniref:Asp/Glu/hydantoin racemase n=1 Tax=Jiangella anatolica TaxID=2670374 RepID=A0A2W2B0F9_9ACTN|nr:aspartate/glutamate racemase family protein [Jiangella anatolica]PZF80925.1 Asp/Glu/hydantoin racemase [Jiangella anatolica]